MHKPVEDEIHDIEIRKDENPPMLTLPKHLVLHITHNDHKSVYQSVAEYVEEIPSDEWVPGTARQRAIETNELWCVHWYPTTPVGFNVVYGQTLQEILDYING